VLKFSLRQSKPPATLNLALAMVALPSFCLISNEVYQS
jgi:hypothetical protein